VGKKGISRSKSVEKVKGSESAPSTEEKTSKEEGGDVYLASSNTHADCEAWLVDSSASFHMTPHMEWFCEYKRYYGGNVFLGDDSTTEIIGRGKVKLRLIDGRIRTLLGVLHIPRLAKNLISVNKMDDAGVKMVFEKQTCMIVRWEMVLLKGVQIGTLYKLQGSLLVMGVIVPLFLILEHKKKKILQSLDKRLCCGIKDWGILERRVFNYYTVKVWLKVCLTALWILIYVNLVYMGSKVR
jgi:hypothetical protein